MPWKMFNPCSPCCGIPLVIISTFDSSVNYTHLCFYENAMGNPGNSCPPGTQMTDPAGSCVHAPKQWDKDKWNLDVENFTDTREANETSWPVAGGIITGGYQCWAGVKEAITAITEPWVEDTYGDFEFRTSGTSSTARITLSDLQELFTTCFEKHEFADNDATFGFLFIIDNTGSISVSQWPASVKTQFLDWIEQEYPNCQVKEVTLTDYLVDGEDWVRHCDEYYQDVVENGLE